MGTSVTTPEVPQTPPVTSNEELIKKIRDEVKAEYEKKLETWKVTELAEWEVKQDTKIQEMVGKYWEKWKEEQKPLDSSQMQQLLDQEYLEFTVEVRAGGDRRKFTIVELPKAAEHKFYKIFTSKMIDKASELASFVQRTMDEGLDVKIKSFMEVFDDGVDMLAETTALVLNPFGKEPDVTKTWVSENISMWRQWQIVRAQIEANRVRDFFSQLFLNGQKASLMTEPLSYQRLQQLAQ